MCIFFFLVKWTEHMNWHFLIITWQHPNVHKSIKKLHMFIWKVRTNAPNSKRFTQIFLHLSRSLFFEFFLFATLFVNLYLWLCSAYLQVSLRVEHIHLKEQNKNSSITYSNLTKFKQQQLKIYSTSQSETVIFTLYWTMQKIIHCQREKIRFSANYLIAWILITQNKNSSNSWENAEFPISFHRQLK